MPVLAPGETIDSSENLPIIIQKSTGQVVEFGQAGPHDRFLASITLVLSRFYLVLGRGSLLAKPNPRFCQL